MKPNWMGISEKGEIVNQDGIIDKRWKNEDMKDDMEREERYQDLMEETGRSY